MQHDDFYEKLGDLAYEYRMTPWWKPFKAFKLRREIHRRWNHFIQEVCDEQDTSGSTD
jgi:hypothetical protein